jgi:hypothetical protein
MRAENKLLEPDTYNEVAGKVVVNVKYIPPVPNQVPLFPLFLFPA